MVCCHEYPPVARIQQALGVSFTTAVRKICFVPCPAGLDWQKSLAVTKSVTADTLARRDAPQWLAGMPPQPRCFGLGNPFCRQTAGVPDGVNRCVEFLRVELLFLRQPGNPLVQVSPFAAGRADGEQPKDQRRLKRLQNLHVSSLMWGVFARTKNAPVKIKTITRLVCQFSTCQSLTFSVSCAASKAIFAPTRSTAIIAAPSSCG